MRIFRIIKHFRKFKELGLPIENRKKASNIKKGCSYSTKDSVR